MFSTKNKQHSSKGASCLYNTYDYNVRKGNMNKTKRIQVLVMTCLVAFAAFGLIGCGTNAQNNNEEQLKNREFMSQINEAISRVNDGLSGFSEAMSQEDIVSMKHQVEEAAKAVEDLDKIEAPEGLGDIKTGYLDGCKKLQEALEQYLTLYTDISNETLDANTYDTRLGDIKKLYEGGIKDLQAADEKATEQE